MYIPLIIDTYYNHNYSSTMLVMLTYRHVKTIVRLHSGYLNECVNTQAFVCFLLIVHLSLWT